MPSQRLGAGALVALAPLSESQLTFRSLIFHAPFSRIQVSVCG
jgi:hypothetical protein